MRAVVPEHADVVIMGAGLAGAGLAHALSERGLVPVVLERRDAPGMEASSRSAGMVRTAAPDAAVARLSAAGAAAHRSRPWLGDFRQVGGFLVGDGPDALDAQIQGATGRGTFHPQDGLASAATLVRRLLARATVLTSVEVLGTEVCAQGRAVVTSLGTITCRVAVNACGAWAGQWTGLPLAPRKRHVHRLRLAPHAVSVPGAPWCWDEDAGFYFRPAPGGILASSCDGTAGPPGDQVVVPDAARDVIGLATRLQPSLAGAAVLESWAGQRTFAPDGRFVVGHDAREPGLFHLAGLGGHGVTVALALGELAATLVLSGPSAVRGDADAQAFTPRRFG